MYDCLLYICCIFWWFKDVISVRETNVCPHNTKLALCASIGSRYIGLLGWKHLKCVRLEFIVCIESLLFRASFNSRTAMFCRSYGAKGAQQLDHIANSTPFMCKHILAMWPSKHMYWTSLLHAWIWTLSYCRDVMSGKITNTKLMPPVKLIPRFLPPELNFLFIKYMLLMRPVQSFIAGLSGNVDATH